MDFYNQDGLIDTIYFYMWDKGKSKDKPLKPFTINIPDTIIFKNKEPSAWFFTNKKGQLLKKNDAKCLWEYIHEHFSKKLSKSGIAAYFIHKLPHQQLKLIYFTIEELKVFLFNKEKPSEGILQQFVDPNGDKNSLIQVIWSQNIAIFNKKQNKKSLYNMNFDIYERCCTFDGPIYLSEEIPITAKASQQLRQTMSNISYRMQDVSQNLFAIARSSSYFKEDSNGQLRFLFSTSIRIDSLFKNENEQFRGIAQIFYNVHQNIMPLKLDIPIQTDEHIDLLITTNNMRPKQLHMKERCLNCGNTTHFSDFHKLVYDQIIRSQEQTYFKPVPHEINQSNFNQINFANNSIHLYSDFPIKQTQKVQIDQQELQFSEFKRRQYEISRMNSVNTLPKIPPLIQKLHPKLSEEEFQKIKDNPKFTSRTLLVCTNCYLQIISQLEKVGGMDKYIETKNILSSAEKRFQTKSTYLQPLLKSSRVRSFSNSQSIQERSISLKKILQHQNIKDLFT